MPFVIARNYYTPGYRAREEVREAQDLLQAGGNPAS
jgi:hypothetical protein